MLTNQLIDQLNDRQKDLMIWIYNECVNNKHITISNKEISNKTNIPESTVEKYLKLLDDLKLIIRTSEREMDFFSRSWRTVSRTITLNPKFFNPAMLAKERLQRINSFLDTLDYSDVQAQLSSRIYEKRGISTR